MQKILIIFSILAVCFFSYGETQHGKSRKAEVMASSFVAASATALSRADVALARSFIVRNGFKGSFGESIAEK